MTTSAQIGFAVPCLCFVSLALLLAASITADVRAAGQPGGLLLTIKNPAPQRYDYFGAAAAAVDGNILVGARWDNGLSGQYGSGRAWLFNGGTGQTLQMLSAPGTSNFGCSVAGGNGLAVVGASGDGTGAPTAGAAFVFSATSGTLLRSLYNPFPNQGDGFGQQVALVGNIVAVSSPWDSTLGSSVGTVYLFDAGSGSLLRTIHNPDPVSGDQFGSTMTVVGSSLLVGFQNDFNNLSRAGGAYLFDPLTGNLVQHYTNPTPAAYDYFGCSVAGLGSDVLIGSRAGEVYAFDALTGALKLTAAYPTPDPDTAIKVAGVNGRILMSGRSGEAYLADGLTGQVLLTLHTPSGSGIAAMAGLGNSIILTDDQAPVGTIQNTAGAAWVYTGVPEPATLSLLALGGLLIVRRRRS